ncbi:unnamed protein product, partial [Cylicocyclus nassatus]
MHLSSAYGPRTLLHSLTAISFIFYCRGAVFPYVVHLRLRCLLDCVFMFKLALCLWERSLCVYVDEMNLLTAWVVAKCKTEVLPLSIGGKSIISWAFCPRNRHEM